MGDLNGVRVSGKAIREQRRRTPIEQDGWTAREEMHRRAQKAEADAERWKREVDDYRRRATWWADRKHRMCNHAPLSRLLSPRYFHHSKDPA